MFLVRKIIVLSLFLSTVSSGNKLRRCILTANCPDSGTVCKTAAPGVPPDSENEEHYTITVTETSAISTFDPLTDSQYAEHGWEAGVELSDDPVAEVVMQAPDDGNEIQQAPRAKLLLQSDAPSELEVGSILTLHGWRCEVTDAGSPAKTGLLNDDTQVPLNDAGGDSGSLTDSNEGKFFKVGKLKCKVIGKVGETNSAKKAATTTRSTLGNRPTSSYVRLPQTIARPSGTSSQMGRCVCDQNKRFGCETINDCFSRFQNESVACQNSRCPSDLGYTGYCRLKPDRIILNDPIM